MACNFERVHFNMAFSGLGVFLGCSSFICFAIFANYEAAVMGLFSGFLALNVLYLHHSKYKGVLIISSNSRYAKMEILGFIATVFGSALIFWYIFLQIRHKTPILPIKSSNVICLVWAFMILKWGILLYINAKKYSKMSEDTRILVRNAISED